MMLVGGRSAEVMVYVEIPADAAGGESDVVMVTATSSGDPLMAVNLELTTSVPSDEYRLYLPFTTR